VLRNGICNGQWQKQSEQEVRNERERFYPWLYGWNGNLLCFVYFYGVTMNTQPVALKLAGELEKIWADVGWNLNAAAELRRLHEVNQELLEALISCKKFIEIFAWPNYDGGAEVHAARAAIAKAEEQA
jgi:hypothetical protein